MKKDIRMGVRTCSINSRQADAPYVSIWKSFTETHHLLNDKLFINLPIYMSRTMCKMKHFYVDDGT